MLDIDTARSLAGALPEAAEHPHRGRPAFQVRGKIFVTLWPDERRAVLKLPRAEQSALVMLDPDAFAPVPGAWGERGWTSVFLDRVGREVFQRALRTAWRAVAPKRLAAD
jgi:hypothetical protein